LRLDEENRTAGAQKNRFGIRNGGGAKTNKNGRNNGGKDLPVSLRNDVVERPALHQLFIGLKHGAKLPNVYARQIILHVTFLLRVFFRSDSSLLFADSKQIADFPWRRSLTIFF
jgi:hypothetical protein